MSTSSGTALRQEDAASKSAGALFTPGPWTIEEAKNQAFELLFLTVEPKRVSDDYKYRGSVCSVSDAEHIDGITVAEARANARLIKAAPLLVAALEEALEFIEDQEDVVDGDDGQSQANSAMVLATELRSILFKATGRL